MPDKSSNMVGVYVRLKKETQDKINIIAHTRGDTAAEVIRRILDTGLNVEIAEHSSDTLTAAVRKAIRSELKATENRLAKLSAKAGIAAASAMYLADEIYIAAGSDPQADRANSPERLTNIRTRAARYLKEPEGDGTNA
jgi:predicted DNA-binding ribbon-helix-helix protein